MEQPAGSDLRPHQSPQRFPSTSFFRSTPTLNRLPQRDNFARLPSVPNDALAAWATATFRIQARRPPASSRSHARRKSARCLRRARRKNRYLAELMRNEGTLVACDRDEGRIRTLQDNLGTSRRHRSRRFAQHDWTATNHCRTRSPSSPFDRILVDAPCSNTGVMRRRVDLRWRLSRRISCGCNEEQLRILRATIPLLKPDGVLVYSTCSIEPEENEEVVDGHRAGILHACNLLEQRVAASVSGWIRWRLRREAGTIRVTTPAVCIRHRQWNDYASMHDPRFDKLAKLLVDYSTRLKRNEKVLIETFDVPDEMTIALVRAARKAGAIPFRANSARAGQSRTRARMRPSGNST